jgi:ParB/RepB/Spo0J family partition protein
MEITLINVGKLRRRDDARPINRAAVSALADSMREMGVLNPLRVRHTPIFHNGQQGDGYEVIAGAHRLAASEGAGISDLPCVIVNDDDLHAELAMIDENLCRAELGPAETASNLARRKQIYLDLYPETAHHVAGGIARQGGATDKLSFADDTALTTGRDARSIRREVSRGEALGDDLKKLSGTSLDKGVELDALSKMDPQERSEIVRRAQAGEKVSARAGLGSDEFADRRSSKIDADVRGRAAQEAAEIIAEYVPADAWDGLKANLYAAGANAIANALTNITGQSVMDRRYGS